MNLTKEDLEAIGNLIDEKLEEKLEEKLTPINEALKVLLKTQVNVVKDLDDLKNKTRLMLVYLNLPSETVELKKAIQNLE